MEQELREMFSLPLNKLDLMKESEKFMDEAILERIGKFEESPSFKDLIKGHAELLEHKSKTTGFDLYGELLDSKEKLVKNDSNDDFDFFNDNFDFEMEDSEEQMDDKNGTFAGEESKEINNGKIQTRFDRLEAKLKEMLVSNHAPTAEFALSILSSSEFHFLSELSENEREEQEQTIQKMLEQIMNQVENGQYSPRSPAQREILSVNELIDEQTMLDLLGKDVVTELEKVLREGVLARSLEELESQTEQIDSGITDLLHSYFFVGKFGGNGRLVRPEFE